MSRISIRRLDQNPQTGERRSTSPSNALVLGASPDKLLPLAEYVSPLKSEPLNPDLTRELQYGTGFGAPHFLSWLKEHVSRVHNPPYADWDVLNTAGNTDGVDGVLRSCVDRGDSILLEEFGASCNPPTMSSHHHHTAADATDANDRSGWRGREGRKGRGSTGC